MPKKEAIPFNAFREAAGAEHREFIDALHEELTQNGYNADIKEAAKSYVVSYTHKPTKRTVFNYVFRKKGWLMRVYGDNARTYMDALEEWPQAMKDAVKKAAPCRRMLSPDACNPRCPQGYDFILDGERQQKCRYGGFLFYLDDETKPHLREMVRREMLARK